MDNLDEVMAGADIVDINNEETRTAFTITNDEQASWALRKARRLRKSRQDIERLRDAEQERLDKWFASATRSIDNDLSYFEYLLTRYAIWCRTNEDDGRKSIPLPAGVIKSRVTPAKIVVDDNEQFVDWALKNNRADLLMVAHRPSKTAIKDVAMILETGEVVIDGEVIPNIHIEPESFSVAIDIASDDV